MSAAPPRTDETSTAAATTAAANRTNEATASAASPRTAEMTQTPMRYRNSTTAKLATWEAFIADGMTHNAMLSEHWGLRSDGTLGVRGRTQSTQVTTIVSLQ